MVVAVAIAVAAAFLREGRMPPRSTHPRHQQHMPLRRGGGGAKACRRRVRRRRIKEEAEPPRPPPPPPLPSSSTSSSTPVFGVEYFAADAAFLLSPSSERVLDAKTVPASGQAGTVFASKTRSLHGEGRKVASAANCYAPVESGDSVDGDYHYSPGESNRGPAMQKSAGDAATREAAGTAVTHQEISTRIPCPVERTQAQAPPEEHRAKRARLTTVGFQEKVSPRTCFLPGFSSSRTRWSSHKESMYEESSQDATNLFIRPELSNTDDTSSGEVKEVMMPSTTLDLATSNLKALLSSSIETLVEDTEGIKNILEDLQPHLPVTLQVKLWPVVTLSAYRSRVTLARQRIGLRHAQLSLKADIADKCRRLNKKKAALDAKTDTSPSSAELEILRKELKDLEERVRVTKQLIQDKEALIARSHEEAEGLKAELKTDLAEIRALNKQLVTGQDEDDEAEIAEVDRVRASALCALEAFLQ
ncbi:hypothetical protein QYE76_004011 [Lolium multiflorum]|uniref:Uncharacterized protein n=1 Tax=Lolium multiflorum TaxID=4521 RepID=A0AAD8RTM8_LOLMU|nr:hypothetical protein QYE76_004011 [Lolium multiflorum]